MPGDALGGHPANPAYRWWRIPSARTKSSLLSYRQKRDVAVLSMGEDEFAPKSIATSADEGVMRKLGRRHFTVHDQ